MTQSAPILLDPLSHCPRAHASGARTPHMATCRSPDPLAHQALTTFQPRASAVYHKDHHCFLVALVVVTDVAKIVVVERVGAEATGAM